MSTLSLEQNDAWTLRRYVDDLRIWVQSWLISPVSRALGSMVPTELAEIDKTLVEIEGILNGAYPLTVEEHYLPYIKRAILEQKRIVSRRQEELRIQTPHSGLRSAVEELMTPLRIFITQSWFGSVEAFSLPTITDFLTLQAATQVMPVKPQSFQDRYDEKFGFLHSQAEFLPRLNNCRLESWLRGTSLSVAFVDIDDFKRFQHQI